MRPRIPSDSATPYLAQMHRNGWFANHGPLVQMLEDRLARECFGVSAEHVVTFSSGTMALQGALAVSDVRHWECPAFTFPATPLAALNAGRHLTFCDIDPDTWWARPARHSSETGLIAVAPFGQSVTEMPSLDRANVIIDAAASLGGKPYAFSHLRSGWAVIFSLHATKVLGVGEGGVAVFADAKTATRCRSWINFGFNGSREAQVVGTNAKMSEIAAAYSLAALDSWDTEKAEWLSAHQVATDALAAVGLLDLNRSPSTPSPYWTIDAGTPAMRRRIADACLEAGIETRAWWGDGCHRMRAFVDVARDDLEATESIAQRVLGLPMFRGLTRGQAMAIGETVARAFE